MVTVLVYEGNNSDSIMGIAQSEYVSAGVIEMVISDINELWTLLNDNNCMDRDLATYIEELLPSKISFIKRDDMDEMWRY